MNAVATFFGWFCIAMLAIVAACASVAVVVWAIQSLLDRHKRAVIRENRAELGRELIASAHWFSEDPYAHMVVRVLGERIRDGYASSDTNAWRNDARKRTKQEAP